VHAFFPVFTLLQLTSPVWSVIFIIFYPLGLFLHLIGLGGVLDEFVLAFLHVEVHSYALTVPYWFLVPYGAMSLLAIRSRKLFIFTFIVALSVFFFIE